jgi:hypothetical protein
MPDPFVIEVSCEDRGHEEFIVPLVERVLREHNLAFRSRVVSARGGASQASAELDVLLDLIERGKRSAPDLLVVCRDANCTGVSTRKSQIEAAVGVKWRHVLLSACPEPHVELWYLAEQTTFTQVVGGSRVAVPSEKCERDLYKDLLRQAVTDAGQIPINDGIEFGRELAAKVDLYALGKASASFGCFLDDLKTHVTRLEH